ncbi:unnamed protein product [Clavelina lepadiformis]|uniref:Coiled-coil domain-containing protein 24 n=1 Tax=Clavelina lepadiformis TaxID=159417 RepID=A0ABP0FSE6_CLALP
MSMDKVEGEKLEPFKPPFSVWELIKLTVPPGELHLIKSFLGESKIEYCMDLRNELETLLDIWKMVGEQSEPPTISKPIKNNFLPDPPHLREMLRNEIEILAKGLQEKNGFTESNILPHNDKEVIEYALQAQRPHSDTERPGTPLRRFDPENLYTTSPVKLKHVRRNINAIDIDAVADILRDAIQKECKALECDIEFLQKCVEEEHDVATSRPSSPPEEPPLWKLRQVRNNLESQMNRESQKHSSAYSFHGLKEDDFPPGTASSINRPCSSRRSSSGSITGKQSTPPSPNRFLLKPIDPDILHSNGLPASKSQQNFSHFKISSLLNRVTNVQPSSDGRDLNQLFTGDSWIEPSWAECLSQSPPTTGDSGVGSRPATGSLVAIQDRLRALECQSRMSHRESVTQEDNGYITGNSVEIVHGFSELTVNDAKRDEAIFTKSENSMISPKGKRTTAAKVNKFSPKIKSLAPHPPSSTSKKNLRRMVNNLRPSSTKSVPTG